MRYLTDEDIIELNKIVIKRYSPKEPVKVLDRNALNMIVENMKQEVYGKELYPKLEDKGAFLLYHLIKKHIFANGNKRTAYLSLKYFLSLNDYRLILDKRDAVDYIVDIAIRPYNLEEISLWIKNNMNKIS
ncbi:type II toxin-antitoxin system death-on-curing family toxin [Nosocomiicoccus massiliensis]|uniref:type II toxin-antitoxin system death-on-curing family toxin n=1 Tax=Nosocomiicoccus massiliensis TaxID=1232430 RepID=UPI000429D59F|nr:type II toxin-antitoxin system death-on-curing family toxin [Nosocomiicoccus massiliensis]